MIVVEVETNKQHRINEMRLSSKCISILSRKISFEVKLQNQILPSLVNQMQIYIYIIKKFVVVS